MNLYRRFFYRCITAFLIQVNILAVGEKALMLLSLKRGMLMRHLISVLAKVYSQLLLNRLTSWTEKYEKISDNQFRFQKGKSVQDCIYILHVAIS